MTVGQREDRYADLVIEGSQSRAHPYAIARAVMAMADAEQADLRAKIARVEVLATELAAVRPAISESIRAALEGPSS